MSKSGPTVSWYEPLLVHDVAVISLLHARNRLMSEQFEIKSDGKTSTLRLIGAVDVSMAAALQNALLECVAGPSLESVQIDCSGVTQLDVAAAQLILAAQRLPDIDIRVKLPDETGVRDWLASGGIDSLLVASPAGAVA